MNYNERSHAIDLITEINSYLKDVNLKIKKAGGETTLKNNSEIHGKTRKILFPDLLLFGDENKSTLMQGWEIKLPDVEVSDETFINDAIYKAEVMNLNSTILWNFKEIVLYVKNKDGWKIHKKWNDLIIINNRDDVLKHKELWIAFLKDKFLVELNMYFQNGKITTKPLYEITDNIIAFLINDFKKNVGSFLKENAKHNLEIQAYIKKWWSFSEKEFLADENDPFVAYAKTILLSWITRITFAHVISKTHNKAQLLNVLDKNTTPEQLNNLFQEITEESDFYTIFQKQKYDELIPDDVWKTILDFNTFLIDKLLTHQVLQNLLEQTVDRYKREIIGQFTTPEKLAKLLVKMTVKNLNSPILDPCCGTGTIPKQVRSYMQSLDISESNIHNNIWASDKMNMALQITNLALTSTESMNHINKTFQKNIFDLNSEQKITFTSPSDGSQLNLQVPRYTNILSNLPFIPFEIIDESDKEKISSIRLKIKDDSEGKIQLSKKSDYYYYIIIYLHSLLDDSGRIGLILSNSWLATDSGRELFKAISFYYDIESITISGKGKWFFNANVMSSILILNKKHTNEKSERIIQFIMIKDNINDLTNDEIDIISRDYLLGESSDYYNKSSYSMNEIESFLSKNISLNSMFFDISWIHKVEKIILPLNNLFKVIRGMRRGWDPLFYLPKDNDVEEEYLVPVLKSARNIKSFYAKPDGTAFCCSKTKDELKALNHQGALNWINKFESSVNKTGKPLREVLAKSNLKWYEMKPDNSLAEFITSINPGQRIFWSKLDKPSFINQRLIGLNIISSDKYSKDLMLALLNSILGLFFIEASGFGRGLGALDLQKNNIEKSYVLNPDLLSNHQINLIINSFKNLGDNIPKDIRNSIIDPKRVEFDKTVLKCFGLEEIYLEIRKSFLYMINTRLSVNN